MRRIQLLLGLSIIGALSACTNTFQTSSPHIDTDTRTPSPVVSGAVVPTPRRLTPFVARGTEPFWSFEQTATGARYSAPSTLGAGIDELWYTSVESSSGSSLVIAATPVTLGPPINALLTPGACSDGMSDTVYAYTVSLTFGTGVLSGCAN